MEYTLVPSERFYRHRLMRESLEHLESVLAAVALSLDSKANADELAAMRLAATHLLDASDALKEAEREASCLIAPDLIEEQLRASLELVGKSPERLRRHEAQPCSTCGYVDCICFNPQED